MTREEHDKLVYISDVPMLLPRDSPRCAAPLVPAACLLCLTAHRVFCRGAKLTQSERNIVYGMFIKREVNTAAKRKRQTEPAGPAARARNKQNESVTRR